MTSEVERLQNAEIKIAITVPADRVEAAFASVVADAAKNTEVQGFRKGKAPVSEVEKRLDPGDLNGRVINRLLPEAYAEKIKEAGLKPIADPRIEIKKFARGNELIFEITTCETPEVKLGNWRAALTALGQKAQIATAATIGEAKAKAQEPEQGSKEIPLNEVVTAVTAAAECVFSELLVEDETARMLTRLNDRLDSLGLSPEEYLRHRQQTREHLREEYATEARRLLKTEFVLARLSEELQIEVSGQEIEQAIDAAPDAAMKESLRSEDSQEYLKALIRKNKTLEQLTQIAKGSK